MEPQYQFNEKTLSTSEFSLTFDYNIAQVICYDGVYVVLLKLADVTEGYKSSSIKDNVYGVDEKGRILWQIGEGHEAFPYYIRDHAFSCIHKGDHDMLYALTAYCGCYTLNCRTGKLLACGKILSTPNFNIEFDYNISCVLYHDGIYVVSLNLLDEKGGIYNTPVRDNVYGVDEEGRIVWQIGDVGKGRENYPNYETDHAFSGIHMDENNNLYANTFFSSCYTVDHKTGRLLSCKQMRW